MSRPIHILILTLCFGIYLGTAHARKDSAERWVTTCEGRQEIFGKSGISKVIFYSVGPKAVLMGTSFTAEGEEISSAKHLFEAHEIETELIQGLPSFNLLFEGGYLSTFQITRRFESSALTWDEKMFLAESFDAIGTKGENSVNYLCYSKALKQPLPSGSELLESL